ncbi:MAG TPA: DUF3995 domain-containing protein [Candidatus Avipropionibacterium avicola]|uniref:DUF3995 domain-containing protein n=1 Tax=Candidatus Avipropionibacterium avicola TaxID=2840701 RepID=A0A9D1KLM5_9ACTN|nr:DUF3995 domain-containing protein [Candidatus Avipropionibacterium avicola]
MFVIRGLARVTGAAALAAVGGLHLLWASGPAWPAKDKADLADAMVGDPEALPDPLPTAVVGVGALGAAAVVAGAGGESRLAQVARLTVASGLLARAASGGGVAVRAMGLPEPGERARRIDNRWIRPLCAGLGAIVLVSCLRSRPD